MFDEIINKATKLLGDGQTFALAVVIRREAPVSAKTGDKAIILADGEIAGWVGGGCTQPAVIKEAQKAIREGRPRLVRVTPISGGNPQEGIVEYNMTCHGGGTIEVYIEPVLPKTHLIILGKSPVAMILAQLAKVLEYRVSVFSPNADKTAFRNVDFLKKSFNLSAKFNTSQGYFVVSTQGENDEEALEAALQFETGYIAFVASKKKAKEVFNFLHKKGISKRQLKRIKVPAGLDINAHLPEEIAVSILAEIIQTRNAESKDISKEKMDVSSAEAIDPVCGMSVTIKTARHRSKYKGQPYYFCCSGCKDRFEASPDEYLSIKNAD